MLKVGIYEAKTQLSRLIEQSRNGETVIISKGKKPMVKLVPIEQDSPERALGTAKGQIKIADDFFEPLEDFKEYM